MALNKHFKYCAIAHSINLLIQVVIFFPVLFFVIYLFVTPFQQCPISKCGIFVREECAEFDEDDYCVKRHDVEYLDISVTVYNITISSNYDKLDEAILARYGCVNESYQTNQYFHDCYYYDNGLFALSFGFQRKVDAYNVATASCILAIELITSLLFILFIWFALIFY